MSEETKKRAMKFGNEFKFKGGKAEKLGWGNELEDDHENQNLSTWRT